MATSPRALMPDYLRLFALFGIVVVNVQFMAFPTPQDFAGPPGNEGVDALASWLVNGLALFKTYGLFSFMFGVGLGFLMRSAERRNLPFGRLYRNRMIGLLLLGLAHGLLFFPGDILVIYSITGAILYVLRDRPVRRLVRIGAVLLGAQVVVASTLMLAAPETAGDIATIEREIMTGGGVLETIIYRSIGFAFTLPFLLGVQGLSALGWFCLGLAAVKSGMIDASDHPLWRRARRLCLVPGVAASLAAAAVWEWGPSAIGAVLTVAAAPVATIGYLGLIAAAARPPGPIMARVLVAGGSSLSIYLGQSIVLSTVFSAYGLGLWDAVARPTAVAIAVGVTAVLILALSAWRRWFALGPFEWVLRRMTYFRLRPDAAAT